jgi:glucose-1-phosphate cytidylyltransferase
MGTRLSEETALRPKPMVEIGGRPILWHILQLYSHYGFKEFVLALGYKGDAIKQYFLHYHLLNSDFCVELETGKTDVHHRAPFDWKVHLIGTGERSMTGGRLRRLQPLLKDEQTFMLTYGDGVANVNIPKLIAFHKAHGKLATVTAVRPTARFGGLDIDGDRVVAFREKPQLGEGWINGGFFVFNRGIFDYLDDDATVLEHMMERVAREGQLMTYRHEGYWQCMDTVRERNLLEELWSSGEAPWCVTEPSR